MKKNLLLTVCALLLIVIAYTQVQMAQQKKSLLQADDEIVIKTGKASITMKKDGSIVIKGNDISIEGTDKINIKASGNVILKGSKIKDN